MAGASSFGLHSDIRRLYSRRRDPVQDVVPPEARKLPKRRQRGIPIRQIRIDPTERLLARGVIRFANSAISLSTSLAFRRARVTVRSSFLSVRRPARPRRRAGPTGCRASLLRPSKASAALRRASRLSPARPSTNASWIGRQSPVPGQTRASATAATVATGPPASRAAISSSAAAISSSAFR